MLRQSTLLLYVSVAFGLKIPSYVEQCYRNDPKLSECVTKAANEALPHFSKGDSKYGVPPIDPFHVKRIAMEEGTGSFGLKFIFHDFDIIGMATTRIKRARLDFANLTFALDLTVDRLETVGPYEISGRILLLPISGKGRGNITFVNLTQTWLWKHELVTRDGLQYLRITDVSVDFQMEDACTHLDNLFEGQEALGIQMNRILNENHAIIREEFKPFAARMVASIIKEVSQRFLDRIPFNELYPYR